MTNQTRSDLLLHASTADEIGTVRILPDERESWWLADNIHQVLDTEKEES